MVQSTPITDHKMNAKRSCSFWLSLLLVGLASLTNGCADLNANMGLVFRQPLTVTPMTNSFPKNLQPIEVSIQGPLPGKPLCETVWTSEAGPFIDTYESKRIGLTQKENEWVGAASWEYTLFIPFGRIFEGVFKSGLTNAFPNALISSDCQTNAASAKPALATKYLVKVTLKEYSVWEKPLNYLNMQATVDCAMIGRANTNTTVFTYSAQAESLKQPLGFLHWTATPVMKTMSKISNYLAAKISEDILNQLQNQIHQ